MPSERKPLSRRERIELLLEHWPDFWECAARDDGPSGDGGVYLLPGMSRHPSVIELGRALGALATFAPSKSTHLFAYYAAPFRTVRSAKETRTKHGRKVKLAGNPADPKSWAYSRERVLPSWVRLQKVHDGVTLIAQEPADQQQAERRPWQYRGAVFIPQPLLQVA